MTPPPDRLLTSRMERWSWCRDSGRNRARGVRDQNAGPGAGWLVAAGASKKKKDFIKFLPDEALLSTNFNSISSICYIELKSTEIREQIVKIALHIQCMLPNICQI